MSSPDQTSSRQSAQTTLTVDCDGLIPGRQSTDHRTPVVPPFLKRPESLLSVQSSSANPSRHSSLEVRGPSPQSSASNTGCQSPSPMSLVTPLCVAFNSHVNGLEPDTGPGGQLLQYLLGLNPTGPLPSGFDPSPILTFGGIPTVQPLPRDTRPTSPWNHIRAAAHDHSPDLEPQNRDLVHTTLPLYLLVSPQPSPMLGASVTREPAKFQTTVDRESQKISGRPISNTSIVRQGARTPEIVNQSHGTKKQCRRASQDVTNIIPYESTIGLKLMLIILLYLSSAFWEGHVRSVNDPQTPFPLLAQTTNFVQSRVR
ncbi:hypothetical protein FQN57_001113 [Myotisia sp. PD_48]|nr:hypothetical protein FQN57_001113 [Myotisia sp. PD_48]